MDRLRTIPGWFRSLSRRTQIIAAIVALVVVCGACGGVLAAIGAANGGTGQPAGTAQATNTTAPTSAPLARATATATHAKPTPTATAKGCQETGAVFGGPISAFIAKYGPSQATDPTLYDAPTDANRDADIMIRPDTGCVSDLVLAAFNATWDDQQTIAQCAPFIPADASQFNATGPYIDYHSPLGEIVEQHAAGSCHLSLSQG